MVAPLSVAALSMVERCSGVILTAKREERTVSVVAVVMELVYVKLAYTTREVTKISLVVYGRF